MEYRICTDNDGSWVLLSDGQPVPEDMVMVHEFSVLNSSEDAEEYFDIFSAGWDACRKFERGE